MIDKPFAEICKDDLVALVARNVAEHRTLEFKRELPTGRNNTVELVRDLTVLANGQDGDYLVGIAQTRGEPRRVWRRLQLLRRWSQYEQDDEQICPHTYASIAAPIYG